MTEEQRHTLKEKILAKIDTGSVRMRSKVYFVLRVLGTLIIAATVAVISIALVSYLIFSIHESGELFLLGFGVRGIVAFFLFFPWVLLLIDIALLVLLEWLLRSFKIVYRIPTVLLFLYFVGGCTVLALLLNSTNVHTNLMERASRDALPVFGGIYKNIHIAHEERGEFRGIVLLKDGRTLIITHNDHDFDEDDGERTVLVPLSIDISNLEKGDFVYIAGDIASGTITAFGIQEIFMDSR